MINKGDRKNIHQTDSVALETNDNSGETKAVQVQVYESFEGLRDIQEEWDEFVEDVCGDIFMTYDWCRIWWKYYGKDRNLKIFIFRSDDELVGIVPLFFEKIWLGPVFVRVVKIVGADFTPFQFSLPIRDCFIKEVVAELSKELNCLRWDIIHIGPIAGKCGNFVELTKSLRLCFSSYAEVRSKEIGVQTYFNVKGDFEEQITNLGKSERKRIRRIQRFINERESPIKFLYANMFKFKEFFASFKKMHESYWLKRKCGGHFCDWPDSELFHQNMALSQLQKDRLRLLELRYENKCFGFKYAYKFSGRYFAILSARSDETLPDKIDFGRLSYVVQSNEARSEDVILIDSMRGKYDYKNKLGGKLYPIHSIYVTRKGYLRKIKVKLFRLLCRLYNICYYKIWFNRIAPKILKKHKPLKELWIRTKDFSQ